MAKLGDMSYMTERTRRLHGGKVLARRLRPETGMGSVLFITEKEFQERNFLFDGDRLHPARRV
jgi:hypothetical protein